MFEAWANDTGLALTPLEREFLNSSLTQREKDQQAEAERKTRETRLEQRAQRFLRGLVAVLAIALLGAVGLTSFAFSERNNAVEARLTSDANLRLSEQVRLWAQAENLLNDGAIGNITAVMAIASLEYGYSAEADAILLHSTTSGILEQTYLGHQNFVTSIAWSPDGTRIVSGASDQTIRMWDAATGNQVMLLEQPTNTAIIVSYSPDGNTILASSDNGTAILWDASTGTAIREFSGDCGGEFTLISPVDNTYLTAQRASSVVFLCDLATGAVLQQFEHESKESYYGLLFTPDGSTALTYGNDQVYLWNIASGEQVRQFTASASAI
jgi:WD40 repeat protein